MNNGRRSVRAHVLGSVVTLPDLLHPHRIGAEAMQNGAAIPLYNSEALLEETERIRGMADTYLKAKLFISQGGEERARREARVATVRRILKRAEDSLRRHPIEIESAKQVMEHIDYRDARLRLTELGELAKRIVDLTTA